MLRKTESPPDPATAPGKAKLRTWKDATGQFSEQAILVRVRGEQVVLRCTDNNEISVPITTLCMTDRQYLEEIDDKTAVAALDKLGAMIKRSKEGSVVCVNLTGTLITDAELVHLKEMPNLQELNLDGTKVTDAGVVDLQKTLPNCYITKSPPVLPLVRVRFGHTQCAPASILVASGYAKRRS